MSQVRRFEDLEAWQTGRELTRLVYQVSARADFGRDFGLRDQIRRAAVSIVANIAEGYERDGSREFRQFLAIAKGSTGELKAHLYTALDAGFIAQNEFDDMYGLATSAGKLIGGLMRYLGQSGMDGRKYK
jgi:four helix bundle protein